MVYRTRMSEAQASRGSLQAIPTNLTYRQNCMARLADYAMKEAPELRKEVITMLEEYEKRSGNLQMAAAAHRMKDTLVVVSMLETLAGDLRQAETD